MCETASVYSVLQLLHGRLH